jgi:hypothetical protein
MTHCTTCRGVGWIDGWRWVKRRYARKPPFAVRRLVNVPCPYCAHRGQMRPADGLQYRFAAVLDNGNRDEKPLPQRVPA